MSFVINVIKRYIHNSQTSQINLVMQSNTAAAVAKAVLMWAAIAALLGPAKHCKQCLW